MRLFVDIPPNESMDTYNAFWEGWTQSKPAQEIPEHVSAFINRIGIQTVKTVGATVFVYAGIPLLLKYLANIADQHLSRPKLIHEARYTNWYDQLVNAKSRNIAELFIKSFGYGSCISLGAHAILKTDFLQVSSLARTLQCNIQNQLDSSDQVNCSAQGILSESAQKITSFALGALFAIYQVSQILPALEFSKKTEEGKPIFHHKLSSVLENVAKTTVDLKQKKGFLQNILLYGPGGTGKTMMAKFIAKTSDMNYVMISGGDLAQYIKQGTHVSELNKLFAKINNASTPTILFIDEAESLCRNRTQLIDKPERLELLNAFLNHTGENSKKIMLVLATNRPEDLDPAILSRMDHKLQIPPPGLIERKKIIQMHISRLFTTKEIALFNIDKIAENTEGLTGRALFKMINAIFANKSISKNELLTLNIIESTVQHFIEQEKFVHEFSSIPSKDVVKPEKTKSIWNKIIGYSDKVKTQ